MVVVVTAVEGVFEVVVVLLLLLVEVEVALDKVFDCCWLADAFVADNDDDDDPMMLTLLL